MAGVQVNNRIDGLDFRWPFPTNSRPMKFFKYRSAATIVAVAGTSKIWAALNRMEVRNKEVFLDLHQRKDRPLITAANHFSNTDDPFVWGMFPWSYVLNPLRNLRWTMAAHDVCFRKNLYVPCVPIVRGDGIYQRGVDFCLERLQKDNGWIHMFPEGKVNMTQERMRIKWGIARLMMECKPSPAVLPFWITGSDAVLNPNKRPYIPRIGKKITVYFDDKPLKYEDKLQEMTDKNMRASEIRKYLADMVEDRMYSLRPITENIHNNRGK